MAAGISDHASRCEENAALLNQGRIITVTSLEYCCNEMRYRAEYVCPDEIHRSDPLACPDRLIYRWSDGRHVILIHDGGSSGIVIRYCPWCGRPLAASN